MAETSAGRIPHNIGLAGAVSLLLVVGSFASAKVRPIAPERRLNNVEKGVQILPDLAMDARGRTVVAWEDHSPDGVYQIYARRFDARGRPSEGQFIVDEGAEFPGSPSVAAAPDGRFVVTWSEQSPNADYDVKFRVYSRRGRPTTTELAASSAAQHEFGPVIAVRRDGAFTIVWETQQGTSDDSDYDVRARRFTAKGVPAGEEFGVSERTALNQSGPTVVYDPSGKLIVAWTSEKPEQESSDRIVVDARRFARSGEPLGPEVQVSSKNPPVRLSRPEWARGPSIGTDSKGRYLITWGSLIRSGYGHVALARRFDARGRRVGREFVLQTNSRFYDDPPEISMDRNGAFVAVWGVTYPDRPPGESLDVRGARFTPGAERIGPAFRLHSQSSPNQSDGQVVLGDRGRFTTVWSRAKVCGQPPYQYGCHYDLFMRRWKS